MNSVYIFTIGGRKIGFGHLSRIIPIYDEFRLKDYNVKIYFAGDDAGFSILENRKGILYQWQNQIPEGITKEDLAIIDTLEPPVEFINQLSQITPHVYFITDKLNSPSYPFKVINWRIGAEDLNASNGLYGEKFVPIRKELRNLRNSKNSASGQMEIVLSMGAGDILNLIPETLDIFLPENEHGVHFKVVIRSFHPEYESIKMKYGNQVTLLTDLSSEKLFQSIAGSNFAIASGGHSIYEFAYLGIPVIHVLVAENQEPAHCWDNSGFTYPLGMYNSQTYDALVRKGVDYFMKEGNRIESVERGQILIDGNGASRLSKAL